MTSQQVPPSSTMQQSFAAIARPLGFRHVSSATQTFIAAAVWLA